MIALPDHIPKSGLNLVEIIAKHLPAIVDPSHLINLSEAFLGYLPHFGSIFSVQMMLSLMK